MATRRSERRAREHLATRAAILEAARRVAARDGARDLSLRGVAAEAGFAPAALYSYFAGKDELLLALAAEDLSSIARAMRGAAAGHEGKGKLAAAASAALDLLRTTETIAAGSAALPSSAGTGEAERLFNGRMIAALKVLSEISGQSADSRDAQCDVLLMGAALSGLALLSRAGRLDVLGFSIDEVLARLEARFS
ncbi:TetR family transcriptional regulator [Rhizomicrobium electricum]|uniref:HTH tetR-type domain-containing protein n=1 Tax=Rhizomicrobium electricum TaxID=480070 RepID=A0ABP3PD26_9PROT|nr:TetR family transcriptional regulator [Rhizomicrobium electricum]NIJ48640.1 AcrR family transcriptional regulator [Rhizomicrobium electricum]